MQVRGPLKITGWIILSLLIVAVICEGTYQLMGNGTLARLVCTVALIAVAPFLIMPLVRRPYQDDASPEDEKDNTDT